MSKHSILTAALSEVFSRPGAPAAPQLRWTSSEPSLHNASATLSEALAIILRFDGEIQGELFLCPDPTASRLTFPSGDSSNQEELAAAWERFVQTATEHLPQALRQLVGETRVAECRKGKLGPEVTSLADLVCGEGLEVGSLFLLADPVLSKSLHSGSELSEGGANPSSVPGSSSAPLSRVIDVPLSVTLRFGQRQMTVRELLELNTGSLVELDQQVEEPVHLMLGDRIIARGEVVIVDGNYGMRVLEVIEQPMQRLASASR